MSTKFEFSRQKIDTKHEKMAYYKVTQIYNDGFSTISNKQNSSFNQIWPFEMAILEKKLHVIFAGKFKCGRNQ